MTSSHRGFGPFRFDGVNQRVWRDQEEIWLRPWIFEGLRYLVERPGEVVTKASGMDDNMPALVLPSPFNRADGDPRAP